MQSPVAILCSSTAWGGLEINVLHMAEWLREAGKEVLLIGRDATPLALHARRAGVDFHPISPVSRYLDYSSVRRMRDLAAKHGVKALLVNTNADLFRAVLTKLFAREQLKVAYIQHMQIGRKKRDLYHTWLYRKLDVWISPLTGLARQVREFTRLGAEKLHVVPLGIRLDNFTDRNTDQRLARRELALPEEAFFAGVVGRLDPQKNQAILLRAAAPLIKSGMPLKILIVGANTVDDGTDYRRELENLCDTLNIRDSVFFRPFMEDPAIAYAALDVFVLTSEKETYGMVTIEAMAVGLPVIATRSGGTPELVDEGQTGLLFEPHNVSGLTTAIGVLAANAALRESMGRAGRAKALTRYSHKTQIKGLLRAIDG